jgi:hypothetical protein
MLKSKANQQIMEPIATRTQHVRDFLKFFKPQICADIVPITDVYGPTAWDPNIQAIVVSKETKGGADASAYSASYSQIIFKKSLQLRASERPKTFLLFIPS